MSYDLTIKADRDALADRIKSDIDAWSQKEFQQGHRKHLGASLLGDNCWRKLYYNFHWFKNVQHDGRVLRLFQVGHDAEPRFIKYLTGIGFEVTAFDPTTGEQYRISGAKGHYGGSLDGKAKPPAHYNIVGDLVVLTEYKTNGTGKGYADVADKELSVAKPVHFKQMSQYGYKHQLKYGLYVIENKNDSDITIKIVELDWNLGAALERKAEEIIFAKEPPQRISENPDFQDCKWCDFLDMCHHGKPPEVNCRSCRSATPVENGQWHCSRFNQNIPEDFIPKACEQHNPI